MLWSKKLFRFLSLLFFLFFLFVPHLLINHARTKTVFSSSRSWWYLVLFEILSILHTPRGCTRSARKRRGCFRFLTGHKGFHVKIAICNQRAKTRRHGGASEFLAKVSLEFSSSRDSFFQLFSIILSIMKSSKKEGCNFFKEKYFRC